MVKALDILADEVFVIEHSVKEYIGDNKEVEYEVIDILSNGIDVVISFDFLPMLSDICSNYGVTYISWIYDWPNYTLFPRQYIINVIKYIYLREMELNYYQNMALVICSMQVLQLTQTDLTGN